MHGCSFPITWLVNFVKITVKVNVGRKKYWNIWNDKITCGKTSTMVTGRFAYSSVLTYESLANWHVERRQTDGRRNDRNSFYRLWKLQLKLLAASETSTNKTFRYPTKYPGLEVCFVKVHLPRLIVGRERPKKSKWWIRIQMWIQLNGLKHGKMTVT